MENTPMHALPCHIVIVGAGIAGACVARFIAEHGVNVTVLEAGESPGAGASGNPQGALYVKPGMVWNTETALAMEALTFAQKTYSRWQAEAVEREFWFPTGLLQVAWNKRELERVVRLSESGDYDKAVITAVTATQASELAGTTIHQDALWYPGSGWLRPGLLCQFLLSHERIDFRANTLCEHIASGTSPNGWQVTLKDSETLNADAVVLCAGPQTASLVPDGNTLPLKPIRGQVSTFAASLQRPPKVVVCGDGYVNPPAGGRQLVGASFDLGDNDPQPRQRSHEENHQRLAHWLPELAASWPATATWEGRVSFRATTPDYTPIAGPAWKDQSLQARIRYNKKLAGIATDASLRTQGLYILAGLGSKGLSYAPLLAHYVAQLALGMPPALRGDLADRVYPGRFRARQLRKQP